ncbi:MAG: ChaN family lipoprotein [Deltaproteobacteria bacterium]|nr:ChaN family lipoprotein [Deltaproteobacteria bacterium]MBW2151680.1 ChaN family lipoprotein [Deltaproteobacteria bacterium]
MKQSILKNTPPLSQFTSMDKKIKPYVYGIEMKYSRIIPCSVLCFVIFWGCAVPLKRLEIKGISTKIEKDTIISGKTGKTISFHDMVSDLLDVQIVYIGEQHNNSEHHKIQLKIIEELYEKDSKLSVGMEMFDHSYQPILDRWYAGELDEKSFLKKVHWYSNWKYDFKLYRQILLFIKENHIRLIGLNIPFHLPPKIATGGIETLSHIEKQFLPKEIDTSNAEHRAYVRDVFNRHHVKGREDFENFYMAQCVWDEAMAESIVHHIDSSKIVVLAGNGHIYRKFGIPQRVYRRIPISYRTIYLAPVGTRVELSDGDYIWATAARYKKHALR